MLYIHYNQTKPNQASFEYAIQGNNNVDVVCFDIKEIELGFEPTHIYVKVQSKDKKYIDKIELTESNGVLNWHLLAKTTRHKVVSVQLSFETDTQYFQTEMVELTLKPYINAEEEIENDYPMVLQDLQRQIDEMSGGGGASSVEIERVFLSYEDEPIMADYLGLSIDDDRILNDSTRIWVNFKTTPISSKMENEIKNGRFVIRLDYPNRNKVRLRRILTDNLLGKKNSKRYGIGSRSYARNFLPGSGTTTSHRGDVKRNILKNSLIFVNESDIKVNSYGEKYVHKKISLFNYINNMCIFFTDGKFEKNLTLQPITKEEVNTDDEMINFFDDYLLNVYSVGIPTGIQEGNAYPNKDHYKGTLANKFYASNNLFSTTAPAQRTNSIKINPAFTCFSPLKLQYGNWTPLPLIECYSPYFIKQRFRNPRMHEYKIVTQDLVVGDTTGGGKYSKKAYTSAKPRCCILNDNWETNEKAFIKKYPQSDQQIRSICKVIKDVNAYHINYMPIFRIFITQK